MIDYKRVRQIYFYSNELDMRSGMKRIQMLLSVNFSPAELLYTLFIFCSKNRKQIKIYYEDEFGSWLLINKLNYSNFHWPRQIQTGSLMSHSFAAYIAYHKYELGIPFHHLSRHIKEFLNLDMSKQNLANTMAKLSNIIKPVLMLI